MKYFGIMVFAYIESVYMQIMKLKRGNKMLNWIKSKVKQKRCGHKELIVHTTLVIGGDYAYKHEIFCSNCKKYIGETYSDKVNKISLIRR